MYSLPLLNCNRCIVPTRRYFKPSHIIIIIPDRTLFFFFTTCIFKANHNSGIFLASEPNMKFRCKIVDVSCLNHFSRILNTIAKLTKSCTLRLTACKLYFILTDKVTNGGVSMWCELNQDNFFDEYQLEGVSAEQNEIFLELIPENVSRALKMAQNAKSVKMKLKNKHCPCLTVAVELPSMSSTNRIVTHDLPVSVIPRRLWNDFSEPSIPNFDVSCSSFFFFFC
ncbi:checkpoint HUS1 [Pelobates cultripes]|uniref:Checkpoint HUS1 n=1 Tax=Pelobates cultripes TaxID=61616 RepID=A0AAD1RXY2_PELCU|nr:checkpoint HUS1 [Pelobates cultripes]